ncbi:hypothetical protein BESB_080410 [Besnoitia besnoiti]|uniref:Uncharacterized protein n=1 Tax=Besnoitia besnoiti TaxID=94643 RepID=A0A2A9M756_BESBE|nr:hypothetical protein BESB_080410 [Besnoitia besnoiti]PFH33825.1 hypothetical protein BESB_080410 [Besnoitia besnoiti]
MGNHPGGVAGAMALAGSQALLLEQTGRGGSYQWPGSGAASGSGRGAAGHDASLLLAVDRGRFLRLLKEFELEPRLLRALEIAKAKEKESARSAQAADRPRARMVVLPAHVERHAAPCAQCERRMAEISLFKQDVVLFQRETALLEGLLPLEASPRVRTLYSNFQFFTARENLQQRAQVDGLSEAEVSSPYPRREPRRYTPTCRSCSASEAECVLAHAEASRACYKLEGLCTFIGVHRELLERILHETQRKGAELTEPASGSAAAKSRLRAAATTDGAHASETPRDHTWNPASPSAPRVAPVSLGSCRLRENGAYDGVFAASNCFLHPPAAVRVSSWSPCPSPHALPFDEKPTARDASLSFHRGLRSLLTTASAVYQGASASTPVSEASSYASLSPSSFTPAVQTPSQEVANGPRGLSPALPPASPLRRCPSLAEFSPQPAAASQRPADAGLTGPRPSAARLSAAG